MALPQTKLPQRHVQRQALCYRKNTSFGDLQSQEEHQQPEPHTIRHWRAGVDSNRDSGSESESDIDFNRGRQDNSGYSSNADDETEYLNRLIKKFGEEGPQISNLGPVTKEMIQIEQHMFQKCVSSTARPKQKLIASHF
jgi:hypothetical protein